MMSTESVDVMDLYEFNYPDDYIPVRGDTVNYWDNNWRTGVVINSQDNEVVLLNVDNEVKTKRVDNIRISHDIRMRMLLTLDEDDAAANREKFLDDYISRVKLRAEQYAADETASGRMDADRAAEVTAYVKKVTEFVLDQDSPVSRGDIVKEFSLDANTFDVVMKRVLGGHKVFKTGERKSITYRVAGKVYGDTPVASPKPTGEPKTTKPTADTSSPNVIDFIKNAGEPLAKADIVSKFKFTNTQWTSIKTELENSSEIIITGQKRGTRYAYKP
jgi:hypothetical protein